MISAATAPLDSLRIGRRPDFRLQRRVSTVNGGVKRYEWILEDAGLFTIRWLERASAFPRLYWRSRSGSTQTLAMGAAAQGSLSELTALLGQSDEDTRIFGGCRFDQRDAKAGDWKEFPGEFFFIPKAEIIHSGGRTTLAVNIGPDDQSLEDVADWIEALGDMGAIPRPGVLTRWDQPDFLKWSETIAMALADFQSGPLSKVVLARKSCLELTETLTPFALTEILAGGAPACFHFCLQPSSASGAFLGASPELLFRREDFRLESEAVAGTRPRSLDTVEDARLESQLLRISKEQLEHRLVVESLAKTFQKLCTAFSQDERPSVLKLSRVQHLRTAFSGDLKNGMGDDVILNAFHPTPATCGFPGAEAQRFLARHEPFDRGWYAGPFGCVSRSEAEFTVAIRSMLWLGRQLHLYSGAGIVEGSDAEREWNELEDKISGVLHLLSP